MKKSFYNLLTLIGVVAGLGSSNAADLDDKETATTMKRMLRADPTSSNVREFPKPSPTLLPGPHVVVRSSKEAKPIIPMTVNPAATPMMAPSVSLDAAAADKRETDRPFSRLAV